MAESACQPRTAWFQSSSSATNADFLLWGLEGTPEGQRQEKQETTSHKHLHMSLVPKQLHLCVPGLDFCLELMWLYWSKVQCLVISSFLKYLNFSPRLMSSKLGGFSFLKHVLCRWIHFSKFSYENYWTRIAGSRVEGCFGIFDLSASQFSLVGSILTPGNPIKKNAS